MEDHQLSNARTLCWKALTTMAETPGSLSERVTYAWTHDLGHVSPEYLPPSLRDRLNQLREEIRYGRGLVAHTVRTMSEDDLEQHARKIAELMAAVLSR